MKLGSAGLLIGALQMLNLIQAQAQKVNDFPKKTDPLEVKVEKFDKLMLGNHWNEGAIMQQVIFPPAGLDRPIMGAQADCLDPTSEMLAAYSHKYAITKDPADKKIADEIFAAVQKLEKVTGVPGLFARSFNRTDKPLWHEKVMWYPEWHASSSMPGYRWLGDLSVDKFTSILYGVGTYWELCADEENKKKATALIDRFITRVMKSNYKLTDLDGKMTLWGNLCPDLPHQPLNSLLMLMGLKVAHHMTGKPSFDSAYRMLISKYHYDDHQIHSKLLFPEEWRNVGDDYHAARALYMVMRLEKDKSLLNKYRMNLNRHWHDWKSMDLSWESSIWFIMVYQVLTGEEVMTEQRQQVVHDMWGFERIKKEYNIPQEDGSFKKVVSEEEGMAAAMIRNYWFGKYYGLIRRPEEASKNDPTPPEGMVYVPAGNFIMGSKVGDPDERPQHTASTGAFYIDKYEVSNEEFARFDPTYIFPKGREKNAAIVNWGQANAYAKWAGKRLPTEKEWEKAARGTDGRAFPWGNTFEESFVAWDQINSRGGSIAKPASPYGCYDMAGSVWEWTSDWYQPYPGSSTRMNEFGERYKVMRGGASFNDWAMSRTTHRYYLDPNNKSRYAVGFRCVKDAEPTAAR